MRNDTILLIRRSEIQVSEVKNIDIDTVGIEKTIQSKIKM